MHTIKRTAGQKKRTKTKTKSLQKKKKERHTILFFIPCFYFIHIINLPLKTMIDKIKNETVNNKKEW